MSDRGETGRRGEEMVAAFLKKKGYIIVKRNFRCRFGEIDVIAENREHIVFVEVKTRSEDFLVSGIEAVDRNKIRRIRITAQYVMSRINLELEPRFDVAEVTVFKKADNTDGYSLNYIKNAF